MKTKLATPSTPKPVLIELDGFCVKIMPYHHFPNGTHKTVSYFGMMGELPDGTVEIVESSSGNSALAAAEYAKSIQTPITLFLPEGAAPSTLEKLRRMGAAVVLTPRVEYTQGARVRAQKYADEKSGRAMLNQARNPGNYLAHKATAADLPGIDAFVCAGGTYGTIRGYAEHFKQSIGPNFPAYAIELDAAPHLYNAKRGITTVWRDHHIVGMAPTVRPLHADQALVDYALVLAASECEALFFESLRCRLDFGKTSAVNLAVAARIGARTKGAAVGTVTFDFIDRYVKLEEVSQYAFTQDRLRTFLQSKAVSRLSIIEEHLNSRTA